MPSRSQIYKGRQKKLYCHLPPITKTIQARRTRHAGHCWRSKDEIVSDVLLWTTAYGQSKAGRPARTFIQQLCDDTGCNPEDLPKAMNDRETWRKRVRDIRASRTSWWWWRYSPRMRKNTNRHLPERFIIAIYFSYNNDASKLYIKKCRVGHKFTKAERKINHFMYLDDIKIFAKNEKIWIGIFQKDSLSPLLFLITMKPLNCIRRKSKRGYKFTKSQEKISHLVYLDGITIFAKDEKALEILIQIIRIFSEYIGIRLGIENARCL